MKNKTYWTAAAKRALWTVCETAIGAIGGAAIMEEVNWQFVLSASLLAGILSLLKSVAIGMPEARE